MRRLDSINFEGYDPFHEGVLERGAHKIRWYASGNPEGTPMIFCHGGPGGLNRPFYRNMFDRNKWCLIQIEQRGNSVSVPTGELEDNTTWHLIEDMEDVRVEMGVERWLVGGGSWGSTLAIAYAETHPERVRGLLLVCMWLGRLSDIDFWFDAGQWVYPECYEQLVAGMSENEQKNVAATLFDRVLNGPPDIASDAARRIYEYEQVLMYLNPPVEAAGDYSTDNYGRIFSHYLSNHCFLRPNQLLEDAAILRDMPIKVVQGRYDMCTPVKIAYEFKQALPQADLRIVDDASHMPLERNLLREFVRAGEEMYREI